MTDGISILLTILVLTFRAVILHVDSSDVTKNTLLPGLLVFRVLDEIDKDNRLHHGYQILFTGDIQLALDGMLTCTVVSKTDVEVVVPSTCDSFLLSFNKYKGLVKRKKKMSDAVLRAHATAANKMMQNRDLQSMKILISFKNTGEELTNSVFSASTQQTGAVQPKAVVLEDEVEFNSTTYQTSTLYAGFLIARVEEEERMAVMGNPPTSNLADELAGDVAGMGMDDNDMTTSM
jgi:hypothetical protein